MVTGGPSLGPSRWNLLQRVGMSAQPREVRVTFSALTACGASVMSKARHSSGTCLSAASEPEIPRPCALCHNSCSKGLGGCPQTQVFNLVCCILLGSRAQMGRVTGRSFCFRLAMEQTGSEGTIGRARVRDGDRGIELELVLSLMWSLD